MPAQFQAKIMSSRVLEPIVAVVFFNNIPFRREVKKPDTGQSDRPDESVGYKHTALSELYCSAMLWPFAILGFGGCIARREARFQYLCIWPNVVPAKVQSLLRAVFFSKYNTIVCIGSSILCTIP